MASTGAVWGMIAAMAAFGGGWPGHETYVPVLPTRAEEEQAERLRKAEEKRARKAAARAARGGL